MKKLITFFLMLTLISGCSASSGSTPTVKDGTTTVKEGTTTGKTEPGKSTASGTKPLDIKPEIGKTMVYETFELTINSIKKAKGYQNKSQGVMIDYTFKNRDEDSVQPLLGSSLRLFQDGVECSQEFIYSENDDISDRLDNAMTEVKKGVPISCLTYFATESTNPLTIQIEPLFNFDKDQEIKFTTDFPKTDFKASDMSPLAKLGDNEAAIKDGVIDLKLGEVIDLPTFDMVVHGIYLAKDYEGENGILLDYTLKNKKEDSFDAMWNTTVKLYQNGVELDEGMYSSDNATISQALRGKMKSVLPGATVQCLDFYKTSGTKDLEININALWGSDEETIMLKTAYPQEKVSVKTLSARLKTDREKYNVEVKASLPQAEDLSLLGQVISFDSSEITITEVKSTTFYQGKKGLMVFYTFKNTMDENKMPAVQVAFRAYQDGVELDSAYSVDNDKFDKASGNTSKEVQPGAAIECAEGFEYSGDSIVVLEVYPNFDLNSGNGKVLVVSP